MLSTLKGQLRLLSIVICLSPSLAFAEDGAPAASNGAADPPRKMHVAVPAPPPPMHRQARVHNGFYLRGGVGAGGLWPKLLDRSTDAGPDLHGNGFVFDVDALVGGSPADGFAVGGGLFWTVGPVHLEGSGEKLNTNVSLFMVGPFFDAFPNPKYGWHLGAMFGFAGHRVPDHPSGIESTRGLGGAVWFGYDWWVSNEISTGAMLKLDGAITSRDQGDSTLRASSTGMTVLLTALYN